MGGFQRSCGEVRSFRRPAVQAQCGQGGPGGLAPGREGRLREHEGNSWKQLARLGVETQVLKEAYFWVKEGPGGRLEHGCLT